MGLPFVESLTIFGGLVGFLFAFALGANEAANALGTVVGTNALSLPKAVMFGAFFEFIGAVAMGRFVSGTIANKIVDPGDFSDDYVVFVIGMCAAMTGAALWMLIVTFVKLPVSSTHCIIGGIAGFGVVAQGLQSIKYMELIYIIISWIASPPIGGIIAFILSIIVRKYILEHARPNEMSIRLVPYFAGLTVGVVCMIVIAALTPWSTWIVMGSFVALFLFTAAVTKFLVEYGNRRKATTMKSVAGEGLSTQDGYGSNVQYAKGTAIQASKPENYEDFSIGTSNNPEDDLSPETLLKRELEESQERFKLLLFLSSAVVAFAHGGNDVANAVGPFSVVFEYFRNGSVDITTMDEGTRVTMLVIGGFGIALGVGLLGFKVIETVGLKITSMDATSGFCAQLATAITVNFASFLALPVSTTSVLIGAIAGVGLAKRESGAVNVRLLVKIFIGWIMTMIIGFFSSGMIFLLIDYIYQAS